MLTDIQFQPLTIRLGRKSLATSPTLYLYHTAGGRAFSFTACQALSAHHGIARCHTMSPKQQDAQKQYGRFHELTRMERERVSPLPLQSD